MQEFASSPEGVPSDKPLFAIPSLLFDNCTPFSAAQFDTVDQHDNGFHVFVAKVGYVLSACDPSGMASLTALDEPVLLNTSDRYEGGDASASLLEESDFAPYKPRCDVIVNASAHAPNGKPARAITASLSVLQEGATLIDKQLSVCGPRWFIKKLATRRLLELPLAIATLGIVRPNAWRLSKAQPMTHLPIRYESATGGQCRIDSEDAAAKRVASKRKSKGILHEACDWNPVGTGFARPWFLKAEKIRRVTAPQITRFGRDCDAGDFARSLRGEELPPPAGLGAIGRAWLPRRALIGKIEEKVGWEPDSIPRLPPEFDYAHWNCAPADQQCEYLNGQAQFTLVNLCSANRPYAHRDQVGNCVVRFSLPSQVMFVLAVSRDGNLTVFPLSLDTVVIDPESGRLDLVWRGYLDADGVHVSSRLLHITEPDQIARLDQLMRHQGPEKTQGE